MPLNFNDIVRERLAVNRESVVTTTWEESAIRIYDAANALIHYLDVATGEPVRDAAINLAVELRRAYEDRSFYDPFSYETKSDSAFTDLLTFRARPLTNPDEARGLVLLALNPAITLNTSVKASQFALVAICRRILECFNILEEPVVAPVKPDPAKTRPEPAKVEPANPEPVVETPETTHKKKGK